MGSASTSSEDSLRSATPPAEGVQVQAAQGHRAPDFRITWVEQLEPAVAAKSVNDLGDHPSTNPVCSLQHGNLVTLPKRHPGCLQPRKSGPDDYKFHALLPCPTAPGASRFGMSAAP